MGKRLIEKLMAERGWSASKTARMADVNQASFSRILNGKEAPYPRRGQRIADALGWNGPWEELFEECEGE